MSIDGLVTGLDTSNLIRQLMQAERAPQRQLQTRQSQLRDTVKLFTELNAKFKALGDAAAKLDAVTDWQKRSATSSDEAVVTTKVTGTPAPGTMAFTVTSLAATHTVISPTAVAAGDPITDGSDLVVNGVTITAADYGTGTVSDVARAINAADAGVVATAVQTSPGQYRLQLSAKESGAANVFTVSGVGLDGSAVVTQGSDASITVGTGPGAYTISSATNTFGDVMPGLSFTAVALGQATVSVATDGEALADAVDALVKAMNDVHAFIADRSKYDQASKKGGAFLGESMPAMLRTKLANALIDPVTGSALVGKDLGIETDRTGKVSFDRAKFLAAHADDPAAVESFFGANGAGTADDGVAERISRLTTESTRLNTGTISSFIAGREEQIRQLDEQIERWDVRLELRETALRRQFSNLETVLGRLQQQGQWLAGQLASLQPR
jgi:flagellar hook-associated protein 2